MDKNRKMRGGEGGRGGEGKEEKGRCWRGEQKPDHIRPRRSCE